MLIRSQDKKVIICMSNVTVDINIENEVIAYGNELVADSGVVTLGCYSDEDKVIKVLDMIQAEYQYCEEFRSIPNFRRPLFVFQMPEDESLD